MRIPFIFIATLAHELAHDILPALATPDGFPEHETQTDFLCIFMGFGVIQAQGARRKASWLGGLLV